MNAKDIKTLAKKLEREGDISSEEVKEIVNFFEEKHQELNPNSPTRDKEAADALGMWYRAVEKRLPEYGNFMHTVPLESDRFPLESDRFWKNSCNPFCWIIKCRKKLSFLDGVKYAVWDNFGSNNGYKVCKYAGEMRLLPEIYEKIKNMKDVFGREIYATFRDAEARPGPYSKNSLYQTLIIRTALLHELPVVYLDTQSGRRVLMRPSDIDKLSFLLKHTPDDLVRWAYQKGLLDITEMQIMLENEDFPLPHIRHPADICDGFAYECAEIEFLNREDQDEEWVDVIR